MGDWLRPVGGQTDQAGLGNCCGYPRRRCSGFLLTALVSLGLFGSGCSRTTVAPVGLRLETTFSHAAHLRAVYFFNPNDGWVSFDHGRNGPVGLCHTTDGGRTWDRWTLSRFRLLQLYFFTPQAGWASGEETSGGSDQGDLLRTTDGGQTWQVVRAGAGAQTARFNALGGGRGWVIFGGHLLKTNDGGCSWDPVPMPRRNLRPTDLCFFSFRRGYLIGEVPDPGPNDFKVVLLKTTDAGERWQVLVDSAAGASLVWQGVFGSPDTARLAFTAGNYGYYYYQVAGLRWGALHRIRLTQDGWKITLQNEDLAGRATGIGQLRFASPEVGWFFATGPTGGLLRTTDGGKDWQGLDLGPGWEVRSLSVLGPETAWAVLSGPTGQTALKETGDGGRNWRQVRLINQRKGEAGGV